MRRCLESLTTVRGRILEVGCGAGRCIRTIGHYRPDLAAWGCDLPESAIGTARAHGDGVRSAVANAEGMPYPTAAFDAVAIMDLPEHVPDVSVVLAEVRRVCKPGAIGFVSPLGAPESPTTAAIEEAARPPRLPITPSDHTIASSTV